MTKHFYTVKKLPLWIAVSAVILAVGIALFAIFGFNTNTQAGKSFELTYDAVVTIADGGDRVEEVCEDTFDGVGIRYEQKFEAAPAIDNNSLAETGDVTVRYLFGEDVTEAELQAAREVILATLTGEFEGADLYVAIPHAGRSRFLCRARLAGCRGARRGCRRRARLYRLPLRLGQDRHGPRPHRARRPSDACPPCDHPHPRGSRHAAPVCRGGSSHLAAPVDGAVHEDARDLQGSRLPHDGCRGGSQRVRQDLKQDGALRRGGARRGVHRRGCGRSSRNAGILPASAASPCRERLFLARARDAALDCLKRLDDRNNAKKGRYVGKKKAEKAEE